MLCSLFQATSVNKEVMNPGPKPVDFMCHVALVCELIIQEPCEDQVLVACVREVAKLEALLHLTKMYCDKFLVKLVASKTKLLVYTTKHTEMQSRVELASTTIGVDGLAISHSKEAMHVGVLRSSDGMDPMCLLACQLIGKLCMLCSMLA